MQTNDLDRAEGAPLFRQIARAIERRIRSGELGRGSRLPAERELARSLGVNRATVGRAYRQLEEQGLITSRVGSGTVITHEPGATAAVGGEARLPGLARGMRELAMGLELAAETHGEEAIDFELMLPDVDLFPRRRLHDAVRAAVERGAEVLQYGPPAGLASLRRAIAGRLAATGLAVSEDEILIVNGIQQALDLLAKALIERGDRVLVEAPTYANVLPLMRLYGARIVSVPMDGQGPEPRALERLITAHQPKLLYTIPTFHNPTGVTQTHERRRAVIELCARAGLLIVEDGFEEELRYTGEPIPPLAAMAPDPLGVAYLGTFSKGLFPGLRLGYVVARGELLRMLTLAKRYSDYHAALLSQAVLAELIERGEYDRHLERIRTTYGPRMARTVQAIARHFPGEVRVRTPEGGFSLWVELPPGVSATAVAAEARRRGVAVLPGRPFYEDDAGAGERGLRLSITRTEADRLEEGIGILGEVLHEALRRRRQPEGSKLALPLV